MAMNGSNLRTLIKTKMSTISGVNFLQGNAEECLLALAEAIVEHIQSNAIVNTDVTTSVTGIGNGSCGGSFAHSGPTQISVSGNGSGSGVGTVS